MTLACLICRATYGNGATITLGADYYKQSPEQDPRGSAGLFPCLRGGSWYYRSRLTRSAFRLWYEAHDRDPLNGFRLVRELD
jgi:formylglycine-generating enzyme required for sulfatase activity